MSMLFKMLKTFVFIFYFFFLSDVKKQKLASDVWRNLFLVCYVLEVE